MQQHDDKQDYKSESNLLIYINYTNIQNYTTNNNKINPHKITQLQLFSLLLTTFYSYKILIPRKQLQQIYSLCILLQLYQLINIIHIDILTNYQQYQLFPLLKFSLQQQKQSSLLSQLSLFQKSQKPQKSQKNPINFPQQIINLCYQQLEQEQYQQLRYNKSGVLICGKEVFINVVKRHNIKKEYNQKYGIGWAEMFGLIKQYCQVNGIMKDQMNDIMKQLGFIIVENHQHQQNINFISCIQLNNPTHHPSTQHSVKFIRIPILHNLLRQQQQQKFFTSNNLLNLNNKNNLTSRSAITPNRRIKSNSSLELFSQNNKRYFCGQNGNGNNNMVNIVNVNVNGNRTNNQKIQKENFNNNPVYQYQQNKNNKLLKINQNHHKNITPFTPTNYHIKYQHNIIQKSPNSKVSLSHPLASNSQINQNNIKRSQLLSNNNQFQSRSVQSYNNNNNHNNNNCNSNQPQQQQQNYEIQQFSQYKIKINYKQKNSLPQPLPQAQQLTTTTTQFKLYQSPHNTSSHPVTPKLTKRKQSFGSIQSIISDHNTIFTLYNLNQIQSQILLSSKQLSQKISNISKNIQMSYKNTLNNQNQLKKLESFLDQIMAEMKNNNQKINQIEQTVVRIEQKDKEIHKVKAKKEFQKMFQTSIELELTQSRGFQLNNKNKFYQNQANYQYQNQYKCQFQLK